MNRQRRPRRLISLTPLIDVVFILLLFFMLASSFQDRRTIGLSRPAPASASATWTRALLVEIRNDGVRLSGEALSLNSLAMRLAERLKRKPDQRILVSPGEGVSLQETVTVLDRIAAAGARDVLLSGNRAR